jgi:hypothetical protein
MKSTCLIITGAKAMAVQNYLAVKSQKQILESEIRREEYEIEHVPDRKDKKWRRYTN